MSKKTCIIFGAGPAGLTAAYELLKNSDIKPIIYEMTDKIGGISKTANYKGNRMDMGGHRFFSKSDKVMDWWLNILPMQGKPSKDDLVLNRSIPLSKNPKAPDPNKTDKVMLFRGRLSRIFYLRKFFDYPVALNINTILNLGLVRLIKTGLSYIKIRLFPIRNEKSLEDFYINRFGKELYLTFFKDYTEKVWGIDCAKIDKSWGAQRVKGLSISKAILHAIKSIFISKSKNDSIKQKATETSLIGQFMYPKFGPGHLWEEVANIILKKGGEIYKLHNVEELHSNKGKINEITVRDMKTKKTKKIKGDYFISTMPIKDLIKGLGQGVPKEVQKVASGLIYRDFITIGLLVKKLLITNTTKMKTVNNITPDLWIYIQERDVKIGRLQVFNNWSPYLIKDDRYVWLGLEYFANEGDELWSKPDKEMGELAISELAKIDIIDKNDIQDYTVIKVPKAYPAYFGTYNQFEKIKNYTDKIENLFLVGRNGMHRYNNMDHSMLSAMEAVSNIISGVKTKDNIWNVNTEEDYHEDKSNKA